MHGLDPHAYSIYGCTAYDSCSVELIVLARTMSHGFTRTVQYPLFSDLPDLVVF